MRVHAVNAPAAHGGVVVVVAVVAVVAAMKRRALQVRVDRTRSRATKVRSALSTPSRGPRMRALPSLELTR